jgi:flagellar motor switch protein FliN
MADSSGEIRSWLLRSASEQLSQVLEAMAGEAPLIELLDGVDPNGANASSGDLRFWESAYSIEPGAALVLAAPNTSWRQIGSKILAAAGLELDDAETLLSTFQETIDQAFSGIAQAATKKARREVNATPSKQVAYAAKPDESWCQITLAFGDGLHVDAYLLLTPPLIGGLASRMEEPAKPASQGARQPMAAAAVVSATPVQPARQDTKNADLLFDVELPVCISFGRAHLQLRDVMKLTTGSVVELNRTVSEPVEVIVNNCVIARGEVVVVEGNFGVRIHEVISRQERLRTLH